MERISITLIQATTKHYYIGQLSSVKLFSNAMKILKKSVFNSYFHTWSYEHWTLDKQQFSIASKNFLHWFSSDRSIFNTDVPFKSAKYENKANIFDLLLKYGADVNVIDSNGRTPLFTSIITGQQLFWFKKKLN